MAAPAAQAHPAPSTDRRPVDDAGLASDDAGPVAPGAVRRARARSRVGSSATAAVNRGSDSSGP
ncbi:hypothetical protein D0Q02_10785 [Micromonospora craniellae]|uniref:Uncharacterized protein n=1 Tax=Micromonospora craniellae TaxID=2294034 RepID=A0A372G0H4_9ACTN|nr:hypothetical protein D0Q02_10785 [Micromonospora craniellae]